MAQALDKMDKVPVPDILYRALVSGMELPLDKVSV
jgi:hypothetical protein